MASGKQIREMITEIEKLKRETANLKSKVRRRMKRLDGTFDPLERSRIEVEIELLKGKIRNCELNEMKLSLPLIRAIADEKPGDGIDWSKAGRA